MMDSSSLQRTLLLGLMFGVGAIALPILVQSERQGAAESKLGEVSEAENVEPAEPSKERVTAAESTAETAAGVDAELSPKDLKKPSEIPALTELPESLKAMSPDVEAELSPAKEIEGAPALPGEAPSSVEAARIAGEKEKQKGVTPTAAQPAPEGAPPSSEAAPPVMPSAAEAERAAEIAREREVPPQAEMYDSDLEVMQRPEPVGAAEASAIPAGAKIETPAESRVRPAEDPDAAVIPEPAVYDSDFEGLLTQEGAEVEFDPEEVDPSALPAGVDAAPEAEVIPPAAAEPAVEVPSQSGTKETKAVGDLPSTTPSAGIPATRVSVPVTTDEKTARPAAATEGRKGLPTPSEPMEAGIAEEKAIKTLPSEAPEKRIPIEPDVTDAEPEPEPLTVEAELQAPATEAEVAPAESSAEEAASTAAETIGMEADPEEEMVRTVSKEEVKKLRERWGTGWVEEQEGWGFDGLRFKGKFGMVGLKLAGRVAVDAGLLNQDSSLDQVYPDFAGAYADLRSAQLTLAGYFGPHIFYKAQVEFTPSSRDLKDLYVVFQDLPYTVNLRVGVGKQPFSLDNLTSFKFMSIMERSLMSALVPGRAFGAMFYTSNFQRRMTWAAGIFYRTTTWADLQFDANEGLDVAARLTGLPYYWANDHLVHVGASMNRRINSKELTFSTPPETRLTDTRYIDTGDIKANYGAAVGIEAAWQHGRVALQGEYTTALVDIDGGDSPKLVSGYAMASYFLTNDSRPYNPSAGTFGMVRPNEPVTFSNGSGSGALELVFRWSFIDTDSAEIQGGKERNLTAGANWYLTPKMRVMGNYIHGKVNSKADGRFNVFQARFQYFF